MGIITILLWIDDIKCHDNHVNIREKFKPGTHTYVQFLSVFGMCVHMNT